MIALLRQLLHELLRALDDALRLIAVDRTLPQHQTGDPHSFRYVHTAPGADARWLHVQIKASAGGIDVLRVGFVYVPPAEETLEHDTDGNLTTTAQWTYTWDAENRMIQAEQKALPVATGITAPPRKKLTFAYDYQDRRIAKKVEVEEGGTWRIEKDLRFVYEGIHMIAELDHTFATGTGLAGSKVLRTYLWGPDLSGTMTGAGGTGGLLSFTDHLDGTTYHVCSDANGNVTGLVPANGPDAGQLIARFDYDPFGNRITNTGPDVELCPIGFSTQYTDSETGLVAYLYRYYNPQMGRFLSRDPIEEEGGINLYGFVGNDPVNKIDYLGLWKIERKKTDAWAKATAESGDTIRSLARMLKFELSNLSWIRGYSSNSDSSPDDPFGAGCTVEVPNTTVAWTAANAGAADWLASNYFGLGWLEKARAKVEAFAAADESRGLRVIRLYNQDSNTGFNSIWQTDGLARVAFAAHGSQTHKGAWFSVVTGPSNGTRSSPDGANPPYKLPFIMAIGCGTYQMDWRSLVAPGGTFIGVFEVCTGSNFDDPGTIRQDTMPFPK